MAKQKIQIEVEVESPNGLSPEELNDIKGAVEQTLYKHDEYTWILVHDEMGFGEDVRVHIY